MSTSNKILEAVAAGKIIKFSPYVGSDPVFRTMYLSANGMEPIIELEHGDDEWTQRLWKLRAALEVFVTQAEIDIRYLKPLRPFKRGVWEIKNKRPRPSLRVFCMFIKRDCLFVSHIRERPQLDSYEYKQQIMRTRQRWRTIFPDLEPRISLSGSLQQMVTGGHDEFLFT